MDDKFHFKMTLSDARNILGLSPDEDPRPHLSEFHEARERIAELVRTSPNPVLADRYQKGLTEFDAALAVIQHDLAPPAAAAEEVSPEAPPKPTGPPLPDEPPPVPEAAKVKPTVLLSTAPFVPVAATDPPKKKSRFLVNLVWIFVLLFSLAGVGWFYLIQKQTSENHRQERLIFLERQGAIYIENRRWPDATKVYNEIETLSPNSPLVTEGRRSIEAGMVEEQQQFIGYWTGQARAEMEAGRWAEAEAAARQVLDKYPDEKEAAELLQRISSTRIARERQATVEDIRKHIDNRDWQKAADAAKPLISAYPADPEIVTLGKQITEGKQKAAADQVRALDLLKQAQALDTGSFNEAALNLLREAAALSPNDSQITAAIEKMATYGRTIRVPEDFPTPAEALAQAHENDRIVLGEGIWKGPLVVNFRVEFQGAGPAKTTIECPALEGCAITLTPQATQTRISGITFRHETFAIGKDRFSAVLVQGSTVAFTNCRFMEASGHGLMVIDGGKATVSRCRFSDNGWNGASATGKGSSLDIRESESLHNYEHGIETWDGASLTLLSSRSENNSRNGVHADDANATVTLDGNQLLSNDEFGLVLDSGSSGKVTGNNIRQNHLGGMVIRAAAASIPVTKNVSTENKGPGVVLEKGLSVAAYKDNQFTGNQGESIFPDADLSIKQEP